MKYFYSVRLFICSFPSRSTARVILQWVVLRVEETSEYCTVNHRASASNYQLSNMKRPARDSNQQPQRLEERTLTTSPPSPLLFSGELNQMQEMKNKEKVLKTYEEKTVVVRATERKEIDDQDHLYLSPYQQKHKQVRK